MMKDDVPALGRSMLEVRFMPIDRRITNGLAWAGALLVVAVPVADFVISQFDAPAQQIAVIEPEVAKPTEDDEDSVEASLPTPVSERPAAVAEAPAAPVVPATPKPAAQPDPVTTAATGTRPSGNAVDDFINTGRPLPSYISGAGSAAPTQSANVEKPAPAATAPAKPDATATAPEAKPATGEVAVVPSKTVGFPTPVALRPAVVPRSPATIQPPLVIGDDPTWVTAEDLEDWESGPLSEFLAGRQGQSQQAPSNYDADGFFLDQGPNSGVPTRRFPNAYEFYPFD